MTKAACRVLLLSMPLSVPHYPSLALGLLKAQIEALGPQCDVRYLSLDYVDYIGAADHACLTDVPYYMGQVGEWVFADAAHGRDPSPDLDFLLNVFRRDYPAHYTADNVRTFLAARSSAATFVDHCLAAIDWSFYSIVGFSTSFQQTMASLALARRVKRAFPHLLIVFGGVNCQDAMGRELHRRYDCIDCVCTGEGDHAFPRLVQRHLSGEALDGIAGMVVRGAGGDSILPAASSDAVTDMDALPVPDYDDFFAQHAASHVAASHPPAVVFETARGCWWGEVHHCTFCGLNGVTMAFRAKSQRRAYDELAYLVARHRCRDVANADKILDMRYFEDFLPRLAEASLDLTIYYEAKVNLDFDQLTLLSRAGVKKIQFGIETFDTPLLRLMNKGITMLQGVEVLKLSAEAGIYVEWLALSGFPGETAAQYDRLAALLPALFHLQPPSAFIRARADRFSPYATAPGRYGVQLEPLAAYLHLFPFDAGTIAALSHHFIMRSPGLEAHDAYTAPASAAYAAWQAHQGDSALWYDEIDFDAIVIYDRRWDRMPVSLTLHGAAAALIRLCWRITRWRDVLDRLCADHAPSELADAAADLTARALMLNEGARWLTLALRQPGLRAAPSWEQVRRSDPVPYALRGSARPSAFHDPPVMSGPLKAPERLASTAQDSYLRN